MNAGLVERLRLQYGLTPEEARAALLEISPAYIDGGLGNGDLLTIAAAAAPIVAAREAISPWLWILSIIGFGMTVVNTRRIARMYSRWRSRRRAA